jgi:hypothetical protein
MASKEWYVYTRGPRDRDTSVGPFQNLRHARAYVFLASKDSRPRRAMEKICAGAYAYSNHTMRAAGRACYVFTPAAVPRMKGLIEYPVPQPLPFETPEAALPHVEDALA